MEKRDKLKFFKALTTKRLLLICFLGMIFWIGLGIKIFEPDIWRHLSTGQYILENSTFPKEEVFSYTASGRLWVVYSWLAEIIFYKISLLGINWLIVLRVFLITLTFGIILKTVYNLTENFNLAILVSILAIFSFAPSWEERPQLFSFVFTSVFVYILSGYKYKGNNHLWILPVIMVFWVNLHIYFIIGLILITLYIVGESFRKWFDWSDNPCLSSSKIKKLIWILLISISVCFLNPYTYRIFPQILEFVTMEATSEISGEMHSPNFHLLEVYVFEIVIFISFLALILSPRRPDFTEWCIFFGFTHQAMYALRNMPFWGIVAPSIFGPYLKDVVSLVLKKSRKDFKPNYPQKNKHCLEGFLKRYYPFINWLLVACLVVLIGMRFPRNKEIQFCIKKGSYPVGAVSFIKENKLPGPMFNRLLWGAYLIYELYPEYKVAFDGRTQVYGDELLREYCKVHFLGSDWRKILEKYKVNFIIWKRRSPLTQVLTKNKDWRLIYKDKLAVIFIKNAPANKEIIERFGPKKCKREKR